MSLNTAIYSDLKGRVICLPYRCQDVIGQLNLYLQSLRKGQQCEEIKRLEESSNRLIDTPTRWDECISHYLECEHIEKIVELIDKKIDWNSLMNINYEVGGKIIIKSFINSLLWEKSKKKWLGKYREHLPASTEFK